MTMPRLNGDFTKHNDRVRSVLERLVCLVSSETMVEAIHWLTCYCPPLKGKPIDMIDDDEKYERLLGALNELEEGRPS